MDELANREGLQYWQTHTGVLYLLHEEADLRTAEHNSRLLAEHGRRQDVLDYEQTLALEPALGHGQRRFAPVRNWPLRRCANGSARHSTSARR